MRVHFEFTSVKSPWVGLTGCGIERVVDVICHPGCRAPIIATVLDKTDIYFKSAHPERLMRNDTHV